VNGKKRGEQGKKVKGQNGKRGGEKRKGEGKKREKGDEPLIEIFGYATVVSCVHIERLRKTDELKAMGLRPFG